MMVISYVTRFCMVQSHQSNLIGIFAQHKVAANLLMLMMLMLGVWALSKMNTQFFPNFALDFITVSVTWRGASTEDVETAITRPIEQELRTLDHVHKMDSTSANGISTIVIEYEEHTDMGEALDQVKEKISLLRNLPTTSEKPEISKVARYELIGRILFTGPQDPTELRHLAHQMEHELLERGIGKVDIEGLPDEEIAIQIPTAKLEELGLTLPVVSQRLANFSNDFPAGSIGRADIARQLRSLEQRRSELAFTSLPLLIDKAGRLVQLGDVAEIKRRPRQGEVTITYQGQPAIGLNLMRAESYDTLKSAQIMQQWLTDVQPKLPPHVKLHVYDETWTFLQDRINLLLKNGLSGLVLVVAVLFIFLNGRVAFWVAMGIPVSLMAMLAILYLIGGSINMISLFAMIMALGIIVDDAIVVGEDAFTHFQQGERSLLAAEGGAQRMLAPVVSSSLTTIAAFLPLMLISGIIGNILFDIPTVMICVLLASLIECFLVLPGHLRHSFHKIHGQKPNSIRIKLEKGFDTMRDVYFRPIVVKSVEYRWVIVTALVSVMILAIGLLAGGRINFVFFPSPEGTILMTNANFVAGTPPERVDSFLTELERTLWELDKELGGNIVKVAVVRHGAGVSGDNEGAHQGEQFGSLLIELTSPDHRTVRNKEFIRKWQARINEVAGLESLTISERQGGPPGKDIEIRLYGNDPEQLKAASLELQAVLKTNKGVSGIQDDMPFGREQWIYSLTPEAMALGLTIESVGQQLRAAYDGYLAQIFQDGDDEVEVRVLLPDNERYSLQSLENFTLQLPNGSSMPFGTAVNITTKRGFEAIRHAQGRLAIQVSADVDIAVNNINKIVASLKKDYLPQLKNRYSLEYSLEGRTADQEETLADMKKGVLFALALMYMILAWQFASYGWPLMVMIAIPFGLVGAITGHWLLNIDLTILSLFGFFGLSGIVVNDSIVLVTFYKELRAAGVTVKEALIEASCQRLRAVLLTSLTTIFGLLPIIFETSLQAQFLIPMAVSIAFGLMFSTILVLLAIPALLAIYESIMVHASEWEEDVNEEKVSIRPALKANS